MNYTLNFSNKQRDYWGGGNMYSRDTINVSPDTSNSIIKNKTDSLLSSSVFTKIHKGLNCNEFLAKNGGASSMIMDAFSHWHKKDKKYEITPDKYWWHNLLSKVDNHLLQYATNDKAGYSYLAAAQTMGIIDKLYKKYGDDLKDKLGQMNDDIKNGNDPSDQEFEKDVNSAANSAKNKIKKDIEKADKTGMQAGKGNSPEDLDMMDLMMDARLQKLISVKGSNIQDFLKVTIDKATECVGGKATIIEESIFDSEDIEDLVNIENFAHIALFDDLVTKTKKYTTSFDLYIDDSGSMTENTSMSDDYSSANTVSYRNLARMVAFKLEQLNLLRDCYLFASTGYMPKIDKKHLFAAHIGGGTDIAQCIKHSKKVNRPSIIITDGYDRLDIEKDYHKDSFILCVGMNSMDNSFIRFAENKQLMFYDRGRFLKTVVTKENQWGRIEIKGERV
jgi:hypothetical protein